MARSSSMTTPRAVLFAASALLVALSNPAGASSPASSFSCPNITITSQPSYTQINATSPGAAGVNKYGFEDGRVVRTGDGVFHLAVAEMIGDPRWVLMTIGHWSSPDGWSWTRVGTLRNSSGKSDFSDPCAAVWGASFLWDAPAGRWAMIYVCYNSGPSNSSGWYGNFNGTIWLSHSVTPGDAGIDGPYATSTELLWPLAAAGYTPWQGLQGTDSFFGYQLPNGTWAGFYGTAHTETPNRFAEEWVVGFATAPSLSGPWTRYPADDPVVMQITAGHTENPMVFPLPSGMNAGLGGVMGVFDMLNAEGQGFGFTCSADGVNWLPGVLVPTQGGARTPFSLLPMTSSDVRKNAGLLRSGGVDERTLEAWMRQGEGEGEGEEVEAGSEGSAPYFLFYSQNQPSGYESVRTALVTLSW
jgi:hypothetical protein